MTHVTDFQQKVYTATREIPAGKVTTYALLARRIHCRCPRAVGQALRRNPFAPDVPCHRVIASDLTLGGFGGDTHGEKLRQKVSLLRREGVRFKDGKLSDPSQLFTFS
ncbi:MAG: MGMT family protein [Lentisphaeria bacterium]|nr:MGMT family protein [Lentisphaeria bacterium]